MRLGLLAKQKIRHVVGLNKALLEERYRVYSMEKDKRMNVLRPLQDMHAKAERELAEVTDVSPARLYTTPESRRADEQRLRENVAEIVGRLAEVQAEMDRLSARHKLLNDQVRESAKLARGVMQFVGPQDQVLRDELEWSDNDMNPPRVLTRRS